MRTARLALLASACLLLASASAPAATAATQARLDFDLIFADGAGGTLPKDLAWSPAGDRLALRWTGDGADDLRLVAARDGSSETLLTRAALRAAGGDDFDDLTWAPAGDALLLVSAGDLFRLPAALLLPQDHRPGERHPVIVYHYGCPGSQVVSDGWSSRARGLWHKLMAQRGYAVFAFDNTASTHFGKRGEDEVHRRFGVAHVPALEAVVAYLAGTEWADPERLGIWGWSGGGSNTLAALFHLPEAWAAGVSGAPVTDWRLYDTIWTERYLDHPDDNPEGYAASSPITAAGELAAPLLLVHGTGDDNVHPQNSLVLTDRLVAAGQPFEMALYPNQKHGLKGPAERHFYEKMTEFFDRHLSGAPPTGDAPDGGAATRLRSPRPR